MLLVVREGNQLCDSSAGLGVKVNLDATIFCYLLAVTRVTTEIGLAGTVDVRSILRPTIIRPAGRLQYGVSWRLIFHEFQYKFHHWNTWAE